MKSWWAEISLVCWAEMDLSYTMDQLQMNSASGREPFFPKSLPTSMLQPPLTVDVIPHETIQEETLEDIVASAAGESQTNIIFLLT